MKRMFQEAFFTLQERFSDFIHRPVVRDVALSPAGYQDLDPGFAVPLQQQDGGSHGSGFPGCNESRTPSPYDNDPF